MNRATTASSGVTVTATHQSFPVVSLLGVAFVILKLTGFIDWPWLWVLSPFWVPLALAFIFAVALYVLYVVRG